MDVQPPFIKKYGPGGGMNKSNKLRSVYLELKNQLGDTLSQQEILDYAAMMVEASEDSIYEPALPTRYGRKPFTELPVNHIIENYSWKVLSREFLWDDGYTPPRSHEQLIDECFRSAA